jgi:lipopolysaccharide/colanic/teichoic acid biosynthesis glycosyltransferase
VLNSGERTSVSSGTAAARHGRIDGIASRAVDVLLSSLLLLLLSPVFLLVLLAIALDSRGPLFYKALRVGQHGKPLSVRKFRKMRVDASGPGLTISDDDRFTRVGRFLARSKLDELPQLLNVLVGQMSLVGPRPEDPRFVSLFADEYHDEILTVRPGITGLSQLAFADEASVLDPDDRVHDYASRILPQKVSLDRLYARRRTVWMDLQILGWTFVALCLRRDVAVRRETGSLGLRRRPHVAADVRLEPRASTGDLPPAETTG